MNKKSHIPAANHPLRVERACSSASMKHQTRHQAQLREELARDVERFLAAGGSIQEVPSTLNHFSKPVEVSEFGGF